MRRFFLIFFAVFSLILEVAIFSNLKIFGITPNIFLMFLIASSFVVTEIELMSLTFFGSLFLSLFSPAYFGLETLIFIIVISLILLLSFYIFSNINFILLVLLASISTIIFDSLYGGALIVSGFKVDLVFYLKHFMVSKIIINSIIILLFYPLLSATWEKLIKAEGRARLLR